jgi:hypothetical protein
MQALQQTGRRRDGKVQRQRPADLVLAASPPGWDHCGVRWAPLTTCAIYNSFHSPRWLSVVVLLVLVPKGLDGRRSFRLGGPLGTDARRPLRTAANADGEPLRERLAVSGHGHGESFG